MARISTIRLAGVAGLCLGMAGLSPAAMAQNSKPTFDKKLGDEAARERQGRSNPTVVISESDGSDTYSLTLSGDGVSAEINGEKVPQKRIKRHGNRVDILGKDGEVVHTFRTAGFGAGGGQGMTFRLSPRALAIPPGAAATIERQHPPVMLGINLSEAEGGGILVDRIVPGLPAEEAGLKPGDVIVKIDGKDAADTTALRHALADKKGGDTMEVVVKRGDDEKTLTVTLAAWNAEKLGAGQMSGEEIPPSISRWFGDQDGNYAQARKALEEALEHLKAATSEDASKIKADAQSALQDALKALEETRMQGREWWSQNRGRFFGDDGQNGFIMPAPPAPPAVPESGDLQRQLEKMSRQMERLNQRVEQLQRQIEERNSKGEK